MFLRWGKANGNITLEKEGLADVCDRDQEPYEAVWQDDGVRRLQPERS